MLLLADTRSLPNIYRANMHIILHPVKVLRIYTINMEINTGNRKLM